MLPLVGYHTMGLSLLPCMPPVWHIVDTCMQ